MVNINRIVLGFIRGDYIWRWTQLKNVIPYRIMQTKPTKPLLIYYIHLKNEWLNEWPVVRVVTFGISFDFTGFVDG